jgi:uncharacterized protein (DUF433 family)
MAASTSKVRNVRAPSKASEAESRLAITPEMAARLIGVSEARLRSWERIHLQHPAVARKLSERNTVRLYDFQDVLSLLVVRELMNQRMTTSQISRVIRHLRSVGYERPLTELTFAIDGNEIFFQHPDGTWEGARRKNQIVMERILRLKPLREHIWDHLKAPVDRTGQRRYERRRKVHGSARVFTGTRVPVKSVLTFIEGGASDREILAAYPDLDISDVRAARREAKRTSVAS